MQFQIYKLWPDPVPSKFVTVPAPSGFLVSTAALNNTLYTDEICLSQSLIYVLGSSYFLVVCCHSNCVLLHLVLLVLAQYCVNFWALLLYFSIFVFFVWCIELQSRVINFLTALLHCHNHSGKVICKFCTCGHYFPLCAVMVEGFKIHLLLLFE